MSWRSVVVTGIAKLDYRLGNLVIRKKERTAQIHLSEIGLLMVESTTVSLTTALLSEMMKQKIKVVFCDEKHNPESELVPYYGCHDTSLKVKQQIAWSDHVKKGIWTDIVVEKIRQQMQLLGELGHHDQAHLLHTYIQEIEFGDAGNREGHAAKVYFNALFGMDFTRSSDLPVNAALNYGYGIVLSCFTREIVANGYMTQFGLFHDNMFNPFNLASDLMEPFRILIDRCVVAMQPALFGQEEKRTLIALMDEQVRIDGKKQTVANAAKIYCRSIFEALNEGDISMIKWYRYEL